MSYNAGLNILHVEDNLGDAHHVQSLMSQQEYSYKYDMTQVATLKAAVDKLKEHPEYNTILLDVNLPDGNGIEHIQMFQELAPNIPIIILTQTKDDEMSRKALNAGAQEYMVKEHSNSYILQQVIQSSIFRKQIEIDLAKRAYYDDLTGLPNRPFFEESAKKMIQQSQRAGRKEALMFIDLNKFKEINDTYGHAAGNTVLKEVANRLKKALRNSDIVARYAGDEFVVYVDGGGESINPLLCHHIAEKIVEEIEKPIALESGIALKVSLSIGIAIFPDAGKTLDIVMKKADEAMYKAKNDESIKYVIIGESGVQKADSLKKILPAPSNKNIPDKRVLIVDDSNADRSLYKAMLTGGRTKSDILEAANLREAERILQDETPDCILLDYYLPDGTAIDLINKYKKIGREIKSAVVIITGRSDSGTAIEAMKAGAKDYITKEDINPDRFWKTINHAIEKHQLEIDLKEYQNELERSNGELSDFAHTVAHDLKSPMRKIFMFCKMLEEQTVQIKDQEVHNCIDRMAVSSSRMQHLIDDLLSFSQIMHGSEGREETCLKTIADKVIDLQDLWLRENNAKIIVKDLPVWPVHAVKIEQLLTNLITNAVKYRSPDRPVVVTISASVNDNLGCTVYVADNGMGIDHKQQKNIFAPFHRLHAADDIEGSGLGLAICKKIVEKHNGTISVRSKVGEGSVFTFSLPDLKDEKKKRVLN
jgi:diguanylate cyclase (GGDEF)-like protein